LSIELIAILAAVIISLVNLLLGLLRTYYAKYTKRTYQGSVNYWSSWQKRKFDVAAEVLKEMGIESPEDMRKLMKKITKEKKRNLKEKTK